MRDHRFSFIAAATSALALAGCGGGGGGGAVGLPAADNTLPDVVPAAPIGGINDYLATGGTWRVNLDGQVQTIAFGTANLTDALVYDSDTDKWTVNVAGANYVLSNFSSNVYVTSVCNASSCTEFDIFEDNPAVSQYGTFGYIAHATPTQLVEYFVHYGMKTQTADMPGSGTGTYAGTFLGLVNSVAGFDYLTGSADVTANFATGGVSFTSTGVGLNAADTYGLTGSATISGNTYSGTASGSYTNNSLGGGTVNFNAAGSTLSGAFYGSSQTGTGETAGIVYSSSADGEIAGGFWSGQTGYNP